MLPERQKISYAKAVLRRQYTGASQTSGVLVADKFYRITNFKAGDDFSNVGANTSTCFPKGHTGSVFQATATTPTVWTKGSKVQELKVVDLRNYSLEVFAQATETISVTSTNFEGGGASGELTFEKTLLGKAIEELLAEMDPDYVTESSIPRRHGSIKVLV
jgi:hypothetical protein